MAYVINKSKRAVKAGEYLFIPGKSVEVKDFAELQKRYPVVCDLVNNGDICEKSKNAAAKADNEFENKSLERLKAIAKDKGIKISGKTKEQLIEELKETG